MLGALSAHLAGPGSRLPGVHNSAHWVQERAAMSGIISVSQRGHVSSRLMQGLYVNKGTRLSTPRTLATCVQDPVVMAAVVGKDGSVQNLRVISSVSPLLNQAALEAAKQWKYRPYILNGSPIELNTTSTLTFRLARLRQKWLCTSDQNRRPASFSAPHRILFPEFLNFLINIELAPEGHIGERCRGRGNPWSSLFHT